MSENPKLIDKWFRGLAEPVRTVVKKLIDRAEERGAAAYLVGGPVRDLLMGRRPLDTDIVIEGDAIALARTLEGEPGVKVVTHPAFGTATLRLTGGHVDVIMARSETYARPGALPQVSPGTMADDLARRDFTINAIALGLTGARRLLDPHRGRTDLKAGLVRALHEGSFRDDPTRALRAFRYAARLDFEIETATYDWLKRDAGYLSEVTPARIRRELVRIMEEPAVVQALKAADNAGALTAIDPALVIQSREPSFGWWDTPLEGFRMLRYIATSTRSLREDDVPLAARWGILLWDVEKGQRQRVYRRLALTRAELKALRAIPRGMKIAASDRYPWGSRGWAYIYAELFELPTATVWTLAAMYDESDTLIMYLSELKRLRLRLRGTDVIRLGVPEGPLVGLALKELRIAKLTGVARTRRDEERIVREFLERGHDG